MSSTVSNDAIAKRAKIYGQFPVKEMQKRGWLKGAANLDALERQLKDYFEISSLDEGIEILHAAKKTSYDKLSVHQAAWLKRTQQLASNVTAQKYSGSSLRALHQALRSCVQHAHDAAKVPALLSDAGIRLLIIEPL